MTVKGAKKFEPQITFVSIAKIDKHTTIVLNCYVSKYIYPLTQTNYLHIEKTSLLLLKSIHFVLFSLKIQRRVI